MADSQRGAEWTSDMVLQPIKSKDKEEVGVWGLALRICEYFSVGLSQKLKGWSTLDSIFDVLAPGACPFAPVG